MHWRPALAALVVSAAGCSSADPLSATPTTDAGTPVSTPAASTVPSALDFAAPAVGGGTLDMRTYAGTNVALWFWAPY